LELDLVPAQAHVALPRLSLQGKHCYRPKEVQSVPRYYRQLPSNVLYPEIPVNAAFKRPVKANLWLEVCGARHASMVRPGYGFLCEVFFRAEPPPVGRWEAQLAGLSQNGDKVFEYTHPIAEGIWPQSRWSGKELIGDRVIVRPSAGLTEGRYRLLWRLIDRDGGEVMSSDSCDEGLEAGMVVVGEIQVTLSAPQGVARLDKDMK
jgi:hypothetical protein